MKWQFWKWLFFGLKSRPGYKQFLNGWLFLHIAIGIGAAIIVEVPLHKAAQTTLLPLVAIFVGLSFAWVGSAQALLQKGTIEKLAEHHPDGIQTYLYTFQLALLVILVTLVVGGLTGLEIFNYSPWNQKQVQFFIESLLYFLISLTLRECWHVVMGSQMLILTRHEVRKHSDTN